MGLEAGVDLAPEAPAAVDIQALIQTGCVGSKLGSMVRVLKLKLNSLPPENLTTQEGKNQSSSQSISMFIGASW